MDKNRINFWVMKFLTISVTYKEKNLSSAISKWLTSQSKRQEKFKNRLTVLAMLAVILLLDTLLFRLRNNSSLIWEERLHNFNLFNTGNSFLSI